MRALIEYVQLFRTNDLILDDIRTLSNGNGKHGNDHIDGNGDLNGENSKRKNQSNDDFGYTDENTEDDNGDSTIRIFSWNGNKDLVVSLLPDLPLFPYSDSEDVVEGKTLFYLYFYFFVE